MIPWWYAGLFMLVVGICLVAAGKVTRDPSGDDIVDDNLLLGVVLVLLGVLWFVIGAITRAMP